MFKKILVPIDVAHIEKSHAMIDKTKDLADQDGGELVLLTVIPEIPTYVAAQIPSGLHETVVSNAETELAKLVTTHGLPASTGIKVEHGHPSRVIVSTANEQDADLIVIASHLPGLSDYLLGSTASAVVRHARCPVLVLR